MPFFQSVQLQPLFVADSHIGRQGCRCDFPQRQRAYDGCIIGTRDESVVFFGTYVWRSAGKQYFCGVSTADAAYRLWSYARHWLTAWHTGGEGIHSPYLFYWVRHCLYDENQYYAFGAIERQRGGMLRSDKKVTVTDYGTGKGNAAVRRVRDIAASSLEKPKNAQTLFRLVQFLGDREWNSRPQEAGLNILELGTSLGITTAYLASPSARNRVVTLEGSGALAAIAKDNWKALGLKNIECVVGNVDDTLQTALEKLGRADLVFMDANHTEEATLRYWAAIKPCLGRKSVVVLDDIHWSKGMERAWRAIQDDARVTCTMDLYGMGMVFTDPAYLHRHYRLRV